MKQFKYIYYLPNRRFPIRILIFFTPFLYFFKKWFETYQRKIFKKKLEERDYEAQLKFQEFTENFSLKETSILKEFRTGNQINLNDFKKEYLIIFYGDIEFYVNLYKEFEENTKKSVKNSKFLYILESDVAREVLLKFPQFSKDSMIIAYIPEASDKNEINIKSNNIYAVSPENKLLYMKKIAKEYSGKKYLMRIMKDINLKIRNDEELKFIKSFNF